MSVQLLLLQKSIYWSWVYCKITKVKSWIHLLSRALLLLPPSVWGGMCPACPCSSPGTNKPSLPAWLPTWVPLTAPLQGDQESNLKKQSLKKPKEMANFLWQGLWLSQELQFGMGVQDMAEERGCWKGPGCENIHVWIICWRAQICTCKIILWRCVSHSSG